MTNGFIMQTYPRAPVTFVEGKDIYLFDSDGERYLDLVAGVAVVSVGHSHPKVVESVQRQVASLTHVSNLYETAPHAELAERLCGLLGWDDGRVFFANSGAEANECAIKLVRRWAAGPSGMPEREEINRIICALDSFHGRTLATLAATGQPSKWEGFAPLPAGFTHVPFDDLGALQIAIGAKATGVLLEPIQGEGGIVVPKDNYLEGVRKVCDAEELPLIFDEVQTGLGRTGEWFAHQHWQVAPNIITLAKALGNGLPVAACVARGEFAEVLKVGDHATTLGGGPVVCSAALATLDVMESEGLVENARTVGEYLKKGLASLVDGHAIGREVRGKGLMLGLALTGELAADVVKAAFARKVLVNAVTKDTVRLCPPLTIDEQACDDALSVLDAALTEVEDGA